MLQRSPGSCDSIIVARQVRSNRLKPVVVDVEVREKRVLVCGCTGFCEGRCEIRVSPERDNSSERESRWDERCNERCNERCERRSFERYDRRYSIVRNSTTNEEAVLRGIRRERDRREHEEEAERKRKEREAAAVAKAKAEIEREHAEEKEREEQAERRLEKRRAEENEKQEMLKRQLEQMRAADREREKKAWEKFERERAEEAEKVRKLREQFLREQAKREKEREEWVRKGELKEQERLHTFPFIPALPSYPRPRPRRCSTSSNISASSFRQVKEKVDTLWDERWYNRGRDDGQRHARYEQERARRMRPDHDFEDFQRERLQSWIQPPPPLQPQPVYVIREQPRMHAMEGVFWDV
jgi:hypothetical protein